MGQHVRTNAFVNELGRQTDELGIDGESRYQRKATLVALANESVDRGPRSLRVHVVARDGRDSPEVVDAKGQQSRGVVAQVGRRLQVNGVGQQKPRNGDGPVKLLIAGGGIVGHLRSRLRQEVLHDDFLHVTELFVQGANGFQRFDAIRARLANAHQEPRGEGDLLLPGVA